MKTINLPCYGIVIKLDGRSGSISSDLHEEIHPDCLPTGDVIAAEHYNYQMDVIESMVLAHAVAGIDVESPAYIEGVETAVEACEYNELEEDYAF